METIGMMLLGLAGIAIAFAAWEWLKISREWAEISKDHREITRAWQDISMEWIDIGEGRLEILEDCKKLEAREKQGQES